MAAAPAAPMAAPAPMAAAPAARNARVFATSKRPVRISVERMNELLKSGVRPIMRGTMGKAGGQATFLNPLWPIEQTAGGDARYNQEVRSNLIITMNDVMIDDGVTPYHKADAALLSQDIARRAAENGTRSWTVEPRHKEVDGRSETRGPTISFRRYPFSVKWADERAATDFTMRSDNANILANDHSVVFAKDWTKDDVTYSEGSVVPPELENPIFTLGAHLDRLFKEGIQELLHPTDGQAPYLYEAGTRGVGGFALKSSKIVNVISWFKKTDGGGEVRNPNPKYRVRIPVLKDGALGKSTLGTTDRYQVLKLHTDEEGNPVATNFVDEEGNAITDQNAHVAFTRRSQIVGTLKVFSVCLSNLGTSCLSDLASKKIGIRPPAVGGATLDLEDGDYDEMIEDALKASATLGASAAPAAPRVTNPIDDILGAEGGLAAPSGGAGTETPLVTTQPAGSYSTTSLPAAAISPATSLPAAAISPATSLPAAAIPPATSLPAAAIPPATSLPAAAIPPATSLPAAAIPPAMSYPTGLPAAIPPAMSYPTSLPAATPPATGQPTAIGAAMMEI